MAATLKTRTVVYFDPAERKALEKVSAVYGMPMAEIVRRAVRQWLKNEPRRLGRAIKVAESCAKKLGGEE